MLAQWPGWPRRQWPRLSRLRSCAPSAVKAWRFGAASYQSLEEQGLIFLISHIVARATNGNFPQRERWRSNATRRTASDAGVSSFGTGTWGTHRTPVCVSRSRWAQSARLRRSVESAAV